MEFTTERDFNSFVQDIQNKSSHNEFMYLSIFIDTEDGDLKRLYLAAAENHNNKILEDPHFYDAGFDLFLPKNEKDEDIWGDGTRFFGRYWVDVPVNKVDFKVKCCAKLYTNGKARYTPFYTYSRSSISKTPLRLANNQGIIDAGYRGNLIGMFDCLPAETQNDSDDKEFDWYMDKYSRLLQICAPGLVPIYVNIVNSLEELGPTTSRGEGGFGSTGK
jgi:dUTP pyrophosphatase